MSPVFNDAEPRAQLIWTVLRLEMNPKNNKDEKAKQNLAEFELLLEELRRAWKPRDRVEESLVRAIAEAEWRLRRAGELK